MIFFYAYKIEFYEDNTPIIAEGLTYGESWLDVMKHLIEIYGDDEITQILDINILGDGGPCIEREDIKFTNEEEK